MVYKLYFSVLLTFISIHVSYCQGSKEEPKRFSSISEALSTPDEVKILDLTDQGLTEIPSRLVELKNLREIYLCENPQLDLKQAFNVLESVKSLEELWITEADLDSIPLEIRKLQTLKDLWLDGNNLTEIPKGVKMLNNLEGLSFFSNGLSKIDLKNGELPKLKYINLCYNEFEVFPTQLVQVERVVIWYNHIRDIPASIKNMTKLRLLNLEHNNLENIPDELAKLKLIELDLGRNYLTEESIKSLLKIESLEILDLGSNQIQSVPKRLGKLKNLKKLTLSYNPIKNLPKELSRLRRLEQIGLGQLADFDWQGCFSILGSLSNLRRVGMFSMGLETMPAGFEKLDQVETFWLTFNRFSNSEKERITHLVPNAKITFK